jgi:hypothetical protein
MGYLQRDRLPNELRPNPNSLGDYVQDFRDVSQAFHFLLKLDLMCVHLGRQGGDLHIVVVQGGPDGPEIIVAALGDRFMQRVNLFFGLASGFKVNQVAAQQQILILKGLR